MKPPDKKTERKTGLDDDRRHAQLGRIVRKGLERTYGAAPEVAPAEHLYRQAVDRRPTAVRYWPLFLGGFGAVCASAALALAWFGPAAARDLAWVSETSAGVTSSPATVGSAEAAEVVRFSEGSVVTFRSTAWGRILASTPQGARLELGEGRAKFQLTPRQGADWQIQAGPYVLEAQGGEFEAAWTPRQAILSIGLFAGKIVVRGPGASDPAGRALHSGESLVARARDGLVRVGNGRVLMAALTPEETDDGVGQALVGEEEPIESGNYKGGSVPPTELPAAVLAGRAPDESGQCSPTESAAAALVPDPGPVSLATCRHADPGPTGQAVVARPTAEPWVRPGAGGCLHYAEDARGNRIPDFSNAGYRGGGVALPTVAAPAGTAPLLPGATGDDTPAIQAAIDAVGALPVSAQGVRGAVELGPGVFTLKGTLLLAKSGVVLRGSGTEGPDATVLRGVGNSRDLIKLGPRGRRRPGREVFPVTDVYVPVGARSFSVERASNLRVGDEIIVFRPKSQRWICAIGTDVMPARADGRANAPWRANGSLSFERRITKIEGNRITVDAPLTNALEKEYTQAFVTELEFPDRVSEIGVENLAARAEFPGAGHCPTSRARFIRADTLVNGWVRHVRSENLGGEAVSLGSGSKWMTIEDATYSAAELERCPALLGFTIGGQQNLIQRARVHGSHFTALTTETEVEGPNVVVDFLGVGRDLKVSVAPKWTTGLLLDNVRLQDAAGVPSGEIDLGRAGSTFGWSAANSVLWNSDAEGMSVDSPPTAHNWIMGGARGAKSMVGTGVYSAQRTVLQPQSLYRAQLVERLGRGSLAALGRSPMGTLPGTVTGPAGPVDGASPAGSTGAGFGNAGAGTGNTGAGSVIAPNSVGR